MLVSPIISVIHSFGGLMLNYKSIGKRIRHYRKRRGYTQEQLGLSINTSGGYISNIERGVKKPSNIERGVKKPSLDNLASIADILDVTVNDIIHPMHDELAQRKINDLLTHCSPLERARIEANLHEIITILKQDD